MRILFGFKMTGKADRPSWQPSGYSKLCMVMTFADGKCDEASKLYQVPIL